MIFVDTSFWVAVANRRDGLHDIAQTLAVRHAGSGLVTSSQVKGETWTFLRRRAGHAAAVAFLDRLASSPRLEIVSVPAEIEDQAFEWLRRRDERAYSFIDATSFALMTSLGIRRALAFDDDFAAAGFDIVRA